VQVAYTKHMLTIHAQAMVANNWKCLKPCIGLLPVCRRVKSPACGSRCSGCANSHEVFEDLALIKAQGTHGAHINSLG
jgi:hypothetical protein